MALKSLNRFSSIRLWAISTRNLWLSFRYGIRLGRHTSLSLSSRIVTRRRGDIVIGADTLVAFKTLILSYDPVSDRDLPVRIGERCFVGGASTVLPGVTIGDECIVGAGSVVFHDMPDRTIAAGNPARILREGIEVGQYGRLKSADLTSTGMGD